MMRLILLLLLLLSGRNESDGASESSHYRETRKSLYLSHDPIMICKRQLLFLWPLLFFAFLGLGKFFFINLKHSYFFKLNVTRLEAESTERVSAALDFFSSTTPRSDFLRSNGQRRIKVCVGILTVVRPERYLIQTVHAILKYITPRERENIYLFAVTGNKNIVGKQRDDLTLIASYFDNILLSPSATQKTRKHSSNLNLDYAKALRHCARKAEQSPYTLIIEDDALAAPFLFSRVSEVIRLVKGEGKTSLNSRYIDFFTLKLYSSECYFGWELSVRDVGLLVTIATILSSISVTTLVLGPKSIRRFQYRPNGNFRKKRKLTNFQFYEIFLHVLAAFIFFVCTLLCLGKQNIFQPYSRNGIHSFHRNTIDSGTLATLFQTKNNILLAENIEKISFEEPYQPIDLLISNWAVKNNRQRLYYIPSLFQHIGLWSTSEYKRVAQKRRLKSGQEILNFKSSDSFERYFTVKR